MKKIYLVFQNYEAHDSDHWNTWKEEKIISYHATEEGANSKVSALVDENVKRIEALYELNKEGWTKEQWEFSQVTPARHNIITIYEGNASNEESIDYPIYFVRPMELED